MLLAPCYFVASPQQSRNKLEVVPKKAGKCCILALVLSKDCFCVLMLIAMHQQKRNEKNN